ERDNERGTRGRDQRMMDRRIFLKLTGFVAAAGALEALPVAAQERSDDTPHVAGAGSVMQPALPPGTYQFSGRVRLEEPLVEISQLQHVSGAHWNLEIGAISEINCRRQPPAALLFDDIVDYPRGYRVLTGSVSNASRMALTLGLSDELETAGLVQALRGKPLEWEASATAFEPTVLDRSPVFDNVLTGADIDLKRFPAPLWHEHDGGRYIGTGCCVVTSDPAGTRVNVGAYRMMIQEDGHSATINAEAGKQGRAH